MEEERFVLDNLGNILDFEDTVLRYSLPQEEVVKLLNSFYQEIKLLRKENAKLERIRRSRILELQKQLNSRLCNKIKASETSCRTNKSIK